MLAIILAIFKSSGFGSLIGWLGGALNRGIDLKAKAMDHAHELNMRREDRETIKIEGEYKVQQAIEEGKALVESHAYDAMAASYGNDKAAYGGGKVDAVRGLIRPIATFIFVAGALAQTALVFYVAFFMLEMEFTEEQIFELVVYCVGWVFFQAGVCIGWYFANRPGQFNGKLPVK